MTGFTVKYYFFISVFKQVHGVVEGVVLAEHFAQRGTAAKSVQTMLHACPVDWRGIAKARVRRSEPEHTP